MAKLRKEKISIPPPGRWDWNDESQTLEYNRFKPLVEVKEKRKNTKPVIFQNLACEHTERQTQPLAKRGGQSSWRTVGPALHTYNSSEKRIQRDYVTIEDVKQVALGLLQENDVLPIPLCFLPVLESKEMNDFLAALLLYLSCYFERKSLEKKPLPHTSSATLQIVSEQSISKKQVMTETLAKLKLALKQLAFCYSSLVLGLGRFQQHHVAHGRNHVTSPYKDRELYECMYSFFCYVAWVTFSRNDLRGIQEEVGRLLRSDTFNPALRTRVEATEDTLPAQDTSSKEVETKPKEHSQSNNATEQRKSQRRPALFKIMAQRSPLMVSLLPFPSEDAPHLFRHGRPRKQTREADLGSRFRKQTREADPGSRPRKQTQETLCDRESPVGELTDQLASFSFGILGKPLRQFSRTTLMPKNEDDADGDDADIHVRSNTTTHMALGPVASAADQLGGLRPGPYGHPSEAVSSGSD